MEWRKAKRRGRLRRLAAGLAATAAAILPNVASASAAPLLSARLERAETALARAMACTDQATLRVFACDCAARVAPLYERFGGRADLLQRARAHAIATATAAKRVEPARAAAPPPRPAGALDMALARLEADVVALEQEAARQAAIGAGATGTVLDLVLTTSEQQVSRLERGPTHETTDAAPPFRLLAAAIPAAEAIDHALLIAAGGSLRRIDTMCEAIAEAIYLDHVFRTGEPARAISAVFRELAWQRAHLRALRRQGSGV
jgi:hypothetical protein